MAGEPTLHPGVLELLRILQRDVGLLVGMSTHGNTIGVVPAALEAACTVDHLTVSVDSVDPAQYERLRRPATRSSSRTASAGSSAGGGGPGAGSGSR